MVGESVVRSDGGKRRLVINYKGSPYGADIALYPQVMKDVIQKLQSADVDEVVLSEYYERIYNEEQTTMLKELANLVSRLESDSVWSPSHIGKSTESKKLSPRHDTVLKIIEELRSDPFRGYLNILTEVKTQVSRANTLQGEELEDLKVYLQTLVFIRDQAEKLTIIKKMKVYVTQLGSLPADRGIYHSLFEVSIKPSFIGSRIFFSSSDNLELVDQYDVTGTKVYIYKHPDKVELLYYVNPPEYTLPPDKYFLLEKTKEIVAGHRPGEVNFFDVGQARQYFHKVYVATISDIAAKNNINLTVEEKEDLAEIVSRYTIGYGILEILLSDKQLTDVYMDAPLASKPIYVVHSKYGQCQTNVVFSEEEARAVVSRFRALSGRPFDEAHPILDFDLEDLQTRIAVIGKPLSLDGIAFAFRLHKTTPWTLCQFLDQKMFNPFSAGLLSFFVDAQASMLIVGSRGSGKTSVLQAMMQEVPQNSRIIVQEDSVTGDSQILLERNGIMERTTVGKLVDELLDRYVSEKIGSNEVLAFNEENVRVFALDSKNKISLQPVSQFIRHRVSKPIYRVKTRSGRELKVTGDHSLFTARNGLSMPVKTSLLTPGDYIAAAPANLELIYRLSNQVTWNNGMLQKQEMVASVLWDQVESVDLVSQGQEQFVYDFSVPSCENFVCENIIAHNTQELPVPTLRKLGFNIQRLKTRPPLGKSSESEISAEDALRTALRLGDSVLIVGEVRSSIRGNEEVLVVEKGLTKRIPIAELEGKSVSDYSVPTLGFDLKVGIKPLKAFVKHPKREKLLKVTTKTGRSVTVTHDHSLFTATKDFKVAPIECKDLKVGEKIVLPSSIPTGFNDVHSINLLELLPEFRVQNFEQDVRKAIVEVGWKQATKICGIQTGDIYNYFRNSQKSYLPISSFKSLMSEAGIDYSPEELMVRRGTSTPIPAIIPVNEEFCRFLGYYVSEGYYANNYGKGGSVILTNSDEKLLSDMKALSQKLFGITPSLREVHDAGDSFQLRLNSSPLAAMLEKLGSGRTCTEKRIPPIIFGLSKPKIAAFLKTLYSGDGSFTASPSSGNSIRYFSTSRKLVEDVAYLLLAFGIVGTIRHRTPAKGNELWSLEFKDRQMVETFLKEIGFVDDKPKMIVQKWAHTTANSVAFDKEILGKHLKSYPCQYRHLFRFLKCSKNYLKKVANDPRCSVSEQFKAFANGEFFLDQVAKIEEITLAEPEFVYDLSVDPSQNFIGGFGGILLHNTEARALYEAMRVGAVGNVVMGTIHGENAYSIWDRVVNDLGVPTTSFKATDFAVVAAPIRFKGSLKRNRRLLEVTEIKKHWNHDPAEEGGLLQWLAFDANKDDLDFYEDDLKGSEWMQKIQRVRGLKYDDIMSEIRTRAESKWHLVDLKRRYEVPQLLEADFTIRSHNKFMLMGEKQREEFGSLDHEQLLEDWKEWVKQNLLKEALAQKSVEKK